MPPWYLIGDARRQWIAVKNVRFLAVLFCFVSYSGFVFADDGENFVLEQARRRAARPAAARAESSSQDNDRRSGGDSADAKEFPYTPVVLSLTPGLSTPVGTYDTSAALGAIGSLVGSVSGVQASGIFGLSLGDVRGLQYAGIFNISGGEVSGFQAAGVFNIADGPVSFVQAGGVFNIADSVDGVQAGGVFNIAEAVDGAQVGGVFNIAEAVDGVQAAGLFNIADSVDGVMVAGLFNIVDTADGLMVGVVNVADRMDGVAIGVINVIGNGVHDFSSDYQTSGKTLYFGYRTGTRRLYASFFGGLPREDFLQTSDNATLGLGLGRRATFGPFAWDVEAGIETSLGPEERSRFGDLSTEKPSGFVDAFGSLPAFFTLRGTFGMGHMGGFGVYVGVKADFQNIGGDRIPEHLREGKVKEGKLFGDRFEYWPKFFVGIRL
jgi:hypothetical protein